MNFPFGESVDFVRAGVRVDDYSGQPVRDDWSAPEVVLSATAAVAPGGSSEPRGLDRDPVDADLDLLFAERVDVDRSWRVQLRGELWDVVGRPDLYRNPWTGWEGTVVKVKRRDG